MTGDLLIVGGYGVVGRRIAALLAPDLPGPDVFFEKLAPHGLRPTFVYQGPPRRCDSDIRHADQRTLL